MDSFIQSITSGDSDLIVIIVIFGAVIVAVFGVAFLFMKAPAQRRLEQRSGTAAAAAARSAASTGDDLSVRYADDRSAVARMLKPVQKYIEPKDETKRSTVRRQLIQAGYMSPGAVGRYFGIRVILAAGLPLLFIIFAPLVSGDMEVEKILLFGLVLGFVGLYLPRIWLSQRISKRQQAFREGFPDALDMLLVCVEAGLGLNAALHRVGAEMGSAHRSLGEQFQFVGLELQAGKSREQALRNLSERMGIDEVKSLVTLLIQSEALGTSIGQALKVHAADMRIKRMLRAEEKAHMLPVKMAFPLIGFILPCLVLVVLTPAIIKVVRVLLPTLSGTGG
jgi:tight adherence protein C